jgi:hypothetical protein
VKGVTTTPAPARAVTQAALGVRRARDRAGILAALVVTVAAAVALGAGLWAGGSLATRDTIRDSVPAVDTPEGWLQVQTRPASDRQAQVEAGTSVIGELVGDDARIDTLVVGEAGTDFERVAWRITPTTAALTPEGMERLARSLPRVLETFRGSDAAEGGAVASGGLAEAVSEVAESARATGAIVPVPIALLAVLSWIAVMQLARLLGASRAAQSRLLRARGWSSRQATASAVGEAAAVTVAGGVAGAAVAVGALSAMWPGTGPAAVAALWMPVTAGLAIFLLTVAAAHESASRRGGAAAGAGRLARAASPALATLLVLVGAALVWQATTTRAAGWDGWSTTVTILAPTVGLAAFAVIALVVFGPLTLVVARVSALSGGLAPSYPARQIARRLGSFSVTVVLVVLAVGGAVLAGSYAATWTAASTRTADLAAGAPLRAALDPVTSDAVAAAGEVTVAAPVYTQPVNAGGIAARLIAMPVDALTGVITDLPDLAAGLETALAGGLAATPLPMGASALELAGTLTSDDEEAARAARATAWFLDAGGTPVPIAMELSLRGDRFVATATIPPADPARRTDAPASGDWSLVSIDVARSPSFPGATLRMTGMSLTVTAGDGDTAQPLDAEPVPSAVLAPGSGAQAAVSSVVVYSAAGARPERSPAVVTTSFAEALGMTVGADLDLGVDGTGRRFALVVAAIVPALPGIGTGAGVFADLESLVVASAPTATGQGTAPTPPTATEIWASGATADELGRAVDAPVDAARRPGETTAGGLVVLWNAAAVGGAALAGVALVALSWFAARQRAGEVLVLRALGVAPRAQARLRTGESAIVVALAVVLGLVGGAGLSLLLVPGMTQRTLAGAAAAPALTVDPAPILLVTGVLVLALIGAAVGARASVIAQGRSTRAEEAAP